MTFKEFIGKDTNESWLGLKPPRAIPQENEDRSLKNLEQQAYKLISDYRQKLVSDSQTMGDKDDNINHDLIRKDNTHRDMVSSIAEVFSKVYNLEKGSGKLKPSFFSDTFFERIARYAKSKLAYHADDIGESLRLINPSVLDDLYNIWRPGSWTR